MPVRTLQVVHARNLPTATANVVYTVPAGHTLIVKDARITNQGATTGDANLLVRRAGVSVPIARIPSIPATTTVERAGMFAVLEPGDELIAVTAVADTAWLVSGSLLEGVAE